MSTKRKSKKELANKPLSEARFSRKFKLNTQFKKLSQTEKEKIPVRKKS